jgi:hypothetical protein
MNLGVRFLSAAVIPGRRVAASPESTTTVSDYGFRARACGAPRNDGHQEKETR